MGQPGFGNEMGMPAVGVDRRAAFVLRTYNHLFGAVVGFTLFEVFLFKSGIAEQIVRTIAGVSWLWILGGFIVVGWLATRAAHTARSLGAQYAALAGYVVAQGLIFVPMLWAAQQYSQGGVIESAALVSLVGFAGLTAVAIWTRKNFSFLGGLLRWAGVVALVAIAAGAIFGFQLGTWFSVGMIALAGASVLYDTSNVIRQYPEDRYVGAALSLFASLAMMFWYVLRLFMSRD